jgi:hypothetical protein
MKYLYFNFQSVGAIFPPLLIDDAICIQENQKAEIIYLYCNKCMVRCSDNLFEDRIQCEECSWNNGLLIKRFLNKAKIVHEAYGNILNKPRYSFNLQCSDINDLKEIHYRGVNIGFGVVSSFVSRTRNLNPEIDENLKTEFEHIFCEIMYLVDIAFEAIQRYSPDVICLANGRTASERIVFEVARKRGVTVRVLEVEIRGQPYKFQKVEFLNALPHDIQYGTDRINKCWSSGDNNQEIGARFFERKRNSQFTNDVIYTKNQKDGMLPNGFDINKRNISIFVSSEDEIFSIGGDWENGRLFQNQIDGIKCILDRLALDDEYCVYVRVHPNLRGVKYKYHVDLYSFESDRCKIIPPDSPVSTYTLIDNSEKIVVFNSTVGVEANYWRRPVILLGPSFYMDLDVAYRPRSIDELEAMLLSRLECKPIIGSLKYGYYLSANNGELSRFVSFSLCKISFLGKNFLINEYFNAVDLVLKLFYKFKRSILGGGGSRNKFSENQIREKD